MEIVMKERNLSGQSALVTGGSGGIGRAVCVELALRGANVAIVYSHSADKAAETEKMCRSCGVQTLCIQADVAYRQSCEEMFRLVMQAFGRVDILVNNAGITRDNLILRMKPEEFQEVLDVNLTGTFHCMKIASRFMLKQRYGRIVSLSSVVGIYGNAGQVNYAASKAGIIGMTKSLARELAGRNITVNAVAPGMISTEMTRGLPEEIQRQMISRIPMGRPGKAEEVASAVAFLASPEASYITGQMLGIDGGLQG